MQNQYVQKDFSEIQKLVTIMTLANCVEISKEI